MLYKRGRTQELVGFDFYGGKNKISSQPSTYSVPYCYQQTSNQSRKLQKLEFHEVTF